MTYTAIQFRLPSWWPTQQPSRIVQVVEQAPPPQPDYGAQIAELRRELVQTRSEHTVTRSELSQARQELGEYKGLTDSLNRVTGRQDNMLSDLIASLEVTKSQLDQALQDKQYQAIQIRTLQDEVVVLRKDVAHANDQLIIKTGVIQVWQSRAELAEAEVTRLKAQLSQDNRPEGERGE